MLCPGDPVKRPALDFSTDTTGFLGMGNQAAGYAIMTELSMQTPRSILLGDRLIGGGEPPSGNCGAIGAPANRFRPSGSLTVVWLPELHDSGIGNLLFADGSVQARDSQGLRQAYFDNTADGNKSGCTLLP
jgi:prepilin-type processing-associated H-X9-DG protein